MNTLVLRRTIPDGKVFSAITSIVVIADLLCKAYARAHLFGVCNDGVVAGISSVEIVLVNWLFFILVSGVTVYVLVCRRSLPVVSVRGLNFIFAGGLANQISRVAEGCVLDWLPVGVSSFLVNIADLSISVGAFLCILGILNEFTAFKKKGS